MKLLPHQIEAKKAVISEFKKSDRCHIVMACGTGKTFTALAIAEELKSKSIVVFVPSLALISQFMKVWVKENKWKSFSILAVCSDDSISDNVEEESLLVEPIDFPVSSDIKVITNFLKKKTGSVKIIFCTYQSSKYLKGLKIDFGVFDEAHKTAGYDKSTFSLALKNTHVNISKRLFMTATPRHGSIKKGKDGKEKILYSMDDEIFYGKRVFILGFREAINKGLICDYKVIISVVNANANANNHEFGKEYEFQEKSVSLKKAIKETDSKKIITFHSSIKDAKYFAEYHRSTIFDKTKILHISSNLNMPERQQCMNVFKKKNEQCIITNSRCLTEGVDVPAVDMVAFLSPKSSKIDIVQAIGRALRNSAGKKLGYIFLPLLLDENSFENIELSEYSNIWQVLNALIEQDSQLEDVVKDLSRKQGQSSIGKSDKLDKFIQVFSHNEHLRNIINVKILENVLSDWHKMYGQLLKFKERFGHCMVPDKWPEDKKLSTWCHTQQMAKLRYRNLSKDREKLLAEIGFVFNKTDHVWNEQYEDLVKYYKKYGHCKVSAKYSRQLQKWIYSQKRAFHKGYLSEERLKRLREVKCDMVESEMIEADGWGKGFKLLKEHIKQYGLTYTIYYGMDFSKNKNKKYLDHWIGGYRAQYRKGTIDENKLKELKKLKIHLDPLDACWHETYTGYKKSFEAGRFDRKYFSWRRIQIKNYKKGTLLPERKELLDQVGFVFETGMEPRLARSLNRFKKYLEAVKNNTVSQKEHRTIKNWMYNLKSYYRTGKRIYPKNFIWEMKKLGFKWD